MPPFFVVLGRSIKKKNYKKVNKASTIFEIEALENRPPVNGLP